MVAAARKEDGLLEAVRYIPIITTVFAVYFTYVLYQHWRQNPKRYLLWWMIGVGLYGLGTLTEATTTVAGWSPVVFRSWYIAGALLGGAPLAQGTAYLLLKQKTADRISVTLIGYVAMASAFVILSPLDLSLVEPHRLSGEVLEWQWVRLFSPLANTYALIMLVGGAAWSAWRYRKKSGRSGPRVTGNWLIAVGALLPGIGGSFTRAGMVEVLYVTEIVGLSLIYLGYRIISEDRSPSLHFNQRRITDLQPAPADSLGAGDRSPASAGGTHHSAGLLSTPVPEDRQP
jgi:hypothetical protein